MTKEPVRYLNNMRLPFFLGLISLLLVACVESDPASYSLVKAQWKMGPAPNFTVEEPVTSLLLKLDGDLEEEIFIGKFLNCGQAVWDPPPDAILSTMCLFENRGHNIFVYRAGDTLLIEQQIISGATYHSDLDYYETRVAAVKEIVKVPLPPRARVQTPQSVSNP